MKPLNSSMIFFSYINSKKIVIYSILLAFAIIYPAYSNNTVEDDLLKKENDQTVYQIKSMDARSAYKLLAAREGKTLDISARVNGLIENITLSGNIYEKLDMLAKLSNSDWFFSGDHLFVTSATERLSRIITLQDLTGDAAKIMVQNAGLQTTRFPLQTSPNGQFVILSAPAKYIALVETVIESQINSQPETPVEVLLSANKTAKTNNKIKFIKFGTRSFIDLDIE